MSGRRFNPAKTSGEMLAGLNRLSERSSKSAFDAGLPQTTIELIKLRASQINGCAYCLRLHTREALEAGESTDRLAVLSAWRETSYFTPEEEAALELTESVTLINEGAPEGDAYERISTILGEERYAAVFWVATVINSFNRLAITAQHRVRPED